MLHPDFKLNGQCYSSVKDLRTHADRLIGQGAGENRDIGEFIFEWLNEEDFIIVKTSGSTGTPKQIKLQKKHVLNSAQATVDYFGLFENTTALLCLSSQYIAGKMMLVRAMLAGWDLYAVAPEKNPLMHIEGVFDFTAMVPYQVFHSVEDLQRVKKIIIGGGVIPKKLEERLQSIETIAFGTYGMTETISHIAVRQINGRERSTAFTAISEVRFSQTESGCLQIDAPKISAEKLITNDVVELLSPTSFKFLGRIDNVINTGGLKVYPEKIEDKLSDYLEYRFFIASENDKALGERVILIVESKESIQLEDFSEALKELTSFERPKKLYVVPNFLYTETDKIKRSAILKGIKSDPS